MHEAVDPDEYTRHLTGMLNQLSGYSRRIVVVSETPFGPIEDPKTVTAMNAELARYNTAAAQHLTGEPTGLWSDGVHLTELGDTILLQQTERLLADHRIVEKLLDYLLP
ncbi:hypothetical protein [Streptomyces sp. NPDC002845]